MHRTLTRNDTAVVLDLPQPPHSIAEECTDSDSSIGAKVLDLGDTLRNWRFASRGVTSEATCNRVVSTKSSPKHAG